MRRGRKKQPGGLVEVGELLEGALQALGVKGDFEKFQVDQKCRKILGEGFSKALTGVGLKGRAVHLEFNHSIWIQEMNFKKTDLLKRLQEELPGLGLKTVTVSLARSAKR